VGELFVFNRTKEKADTLAAAFDATALSGELDAAMAMLPALALVVSCIPGSAGVCPSVRAVIEYLLLVSFVYI